jgi:hypothetical protein
LYHIKNKIASRHAARSARSADGCHGYIYMWASRLECAMRANSIQVYCLLAILMFYWKLQGIYLAVCANTCVKFLRMISSG